ncbi:MAG TPA: DUF5693 family protein, partial [Actinopolymorphaceae bacterium]|nr:DUF5693 family protein [Actinopolymorphaceae bacterium]
IGTASLVDTFAHFHLPVSVALLRSGYAVVIGLVVGLVGLAVLQVVRARRSGVRRLVRAGTSAVPHDRVKIP